MDSVFFENLKKIEVLKKIGRTLITVKENIIRIFANLNFFLRYEQEYLLLPGCSTSELSLKDQYLKGNLRLIEKPLVEYYHQLHELIDSEVSSKRGFSIIRVSDGEKNFLKAVIKGNTANRHFTKSEKPKKEYIDMFKNQLLKCDSIHVEMYKDMADGFKKIYGKNIFSPIPVECIYAIVSNKSIFSNTYKIGIIGSDRKIEIIKKLLTHKEYTNYITRSDFDHYITVPDKGSSNDVGALKKHIMDNLNPDIDIYLVGIGIAKMAILGDLAQKSNAVFIDVGCGISALAGLVSNDRPYFANWVNFRLKDFDYSTVDIMDADMKKNDIVYL